MTAAIGAICGRFDNGREGRHRDRFGRNGKGSYDSYFMAWKLACVGGSIIIAGAPHERPGGQDNQFGTIDAIAQRC